MKAHIRKLLTGVTLAVACLLSIFVQAAGPKYNAASGILQVPLIDSPDTAGVYQDIEFGAVGNNLWRLHKAKVARPLDVIEQVSLVQVGSAPAQAFLDITGTFPNNCSAVGRHAIRLENNHFEVRVYYDHSRVYVVCLQVLTPFREVIPLPVYGLDAGTYEYTVNDMFAGSFTLDALNVLP